MYNLLLMQQVKLEQKLSCIAFVKQALFDVYFLPVLSHFRPYTHVLRPGSCKTV